MPSAPEIIEVDPTQLEDVLRRVEGALDEKDATLIRQVFQSYVYVTDLVEDKKTSIRRLRELLFGEVPQDLPLDWINEELRRLPIRDYPCRCPDHPNG